MPHSPSDYSQLIEAIQRDDKKAADRLVSDLLSKVIIYLRVRMSAPESVAEECAYQAFSNVFEQIRNDKITDKKSVFKYLLTTARHEYLRTKSSDERAGTDPEEKFSLFQEPPSQLESLLDEERQSLLRKCLDKLSDANRKFILTFFTSSSVDMSVLAEKFGYSYAKARTLKTRIMQDLQQCIQKNM